MDVLSYLTKGVKVDNPQYNPKTNKGATQPPYFVTSDTKYDYLSGSIGATTSNIASDFKTIDFDSEEYAPYDVYTSPLSTQEQLDKERAINQGVFAEMTNSVGQTINELTTGVVVGTADLASIIVDAMMNDDMTYERPEWIQALADFKENIDKAMPIYRENPNKAFDLTDTAWFFSNIPSLASTATLMIPGVGVSKAVSKLGSIFSKMALVDKSLAKAANIIKLTGKQQAIASKITESVTAGVTMRSLENYQEAIQTKKDAKSYAISELNNMDNKQYAEFIKNNPQYDGMDNEDIAEDIARNAADTTFTTDWWNTIFDIYQVYGLKNMWSKALQGSNTNKLNLINKQAAAQFGDEAAVIQQNLASRTFGDKALEFIKNTGKAAIDGGRTEWTEGVEEAINYIAQEKGMEFARYAFDKDTPKKDIDDYLKDPHLWESAFWGLAGGVGFSMIGDKAMGFVQRKFNKEFVNAEKQKENEIYRRATRFNEYQSKLEAIAKGDNPYIIETDSSGNRKNAKIINDEEELLKQVALEEYFDEMIIDAIDNGNLELLEAYAADPNIAKGFREKLNLSEKDSVDLQSSFLKRINVIKDKYANVFNLVSQAGGNYQIGSIMAKEAIRIDRSTKLNKLLTDNNNAELLNLLNSTGRTIDSDQIEAVRRLTYWYNIKKLQDEYNKINADAALSKLEKEVKLKEIDTQRKKILNAAPATMFDEQGNYNPDNDVNIATKLKTNAPDVYNALWKKLHGEYTNSLTDNTDYLAMPNIKKKVADYKKRMKTYSDKAVINAIKKRGELYKKYGVGIYRDAMSEEDKKTFDEISSIIDIAEVPKEELLQQERLLDIEREIEESINQDNDSTIPEGAPTDEDIEAFNNSLEEQKEQEKNQSADSTNAVQPPTGNLNESNSPVPSTANINQSEDINSNPVTNNTTNNTSTGNANTADTDNSSFPVEGSTKQEPAISQKNTDDTTEANNANTSTNSDESTDESNEEAAINDFYIDDDIDYSVVNNYILERYADFMDSNSDADGVNAVIQELINKGIDAEVAATLVNEIYSITAGTTNTINLDPTKFSTNDSDISKIMLINAILGMARKTKNVNNGDENIEAVIKEFVNSKYENGSSRGVVVNGIYYFSVESLITYLYKESNNQAIRNLLFETIKKYVNTHNKNYRFTDNPRILNSSSAQFSEIINANIQSRRKTINNEFSNNVNVSDINNEVSPTIDYRNIAALNPGDTVYYKVVGDRIHLFNNADLNHQTDYIGYLGIPKYNNNNGEYTAYNENWIYILTRDSNREVHCRVKDFIIDIFNNLDFKYKQILFDYINDYDDVTPFSDKEMLYNYIANYQFKDFKGKDLLTKYSVYDASKYKSKEEAENVLFKHKHIVDEQLNHLRKIYRHALNSGKPVNDSINEWFDLLANSYEQVSYITIDDHSGKFVVTSNYKGDVLLSTGYDNYIDEVIDNYDPKKHSLVTVVAPDTLQFANSANTVVLPGFTQKGVTMISIPNGVGGFHVAQVQQVNLENNPILDNAKAELRSIIINFLNESVDYNKTAKAIESLIGDIGLFNTSYKIKTYTTAKGNRGIAFNKDNKAEITFNEHYDNFKTNINVKGGFYRYENNRIVSNNNKSYTIDEFINHLTDLIFKDATIAIPFNVINDAYKTPVKTSIYYKRDKNKTIITLNGTEYEANSYQDFLIKNKLIKTKLRKADVNNKNEFGNYENSEAVSLNVTFVPVFDKKEVSDLYTEVEKDVTTTDNVAEYLKKHFKFNNGVIDYINTLEKIGLFPNNLVFAKPPKLEGKTVYGWYDSTTDTVNINKDLIDTNRLNHKELIRTIIHETLHRKLNTIGEEKRKEFLDNFKVIIDEFKKYIEDNKTILINNNLYDTYNAFINQSDNPQTNIEEFVVDSLTNDLLMNMLNNIKAGKRETLMSKVKSLLHELMLTVARLFGITINRNSLLYKELSIVSHLRLLEDINNKLDNKPNNIDNNKPDNADDSNKSTNTNKSTDTNQPNNTKQLTIDFDNPNVIHADTDINDIVKPEIINDVAEITPDEEIKKEDPSNDSTGNEDGNGLTFDDNGNIDIDDNNDIMFSTMSSEIFTNNQLTLTESIPQDLYTDLMRSFATGDIFMECR